METPLKYSLIFFLTFHTIVTPNAIPNALYTQRTQQMAKGYTNSVTMPLFEMLILKITARAVYGRAEGG